MKTYDVRFRPRARRDLIALYRYLKRRFGEDSAIGYVRRIDEACAGLEQAPQRGTVVRHPDLTLRVLGFERRVSVLFQIGEDTVEILRVLYGGQDIQAINDRFSAS